MVCSIGVDARCGTVEVSRAEIETQVVVTGMEGIEPLVVNPDELLIIGTSVEDGGCTELLLKLIVLRQQLGDPSIDRILLLPRVCLMVSCTCSRMISRLLEFSCVSRQVNWSSVVSIMEGCSAQVLYTALPSFKAVALKFRAAALKFRATALEICLFLLLFPLKFMPRPRNLLEESFVSNNLKNIKMTLN
ncbi:hypothetical protein TIFTF001_039575 [Ficus carica]|uniref:Uncharacterized protein n=1 Tax=Ficus carica TaxID=3494 RepID=A0AA88ECK8_FICCA|nr:hypothetical protein TIFTF001_039567 [Ficus carica]GMN70540.1 hypothetical protein TIFTF001_039575 [Ficus carica]